MSLLSPAELRGAGNLVARMCARSAWFGPAPPWRWARPSVEEPAQASASAQEKKKTHRTAAGHVAHSFATLLAHLGTRCRNTVQVGTAADGATFQQLTEADDLQAEALRLVRA